jgi:hypothetical protein
MLKNAFLLFTSVAFLAACGATSGLVETPGPLEKRMPARPNPTSFVYNKPLDVLRGDVIKSLEDIDPGRRFNADFSTTTIAFFVETKDEDSVFSRDIFSDPANSSDLFVHSYGTPINPPEPVYYANGKPLEYFADFHIHFEAVDAASTRVTVRAHRPRVVNGSECCGPHGSVAIYQDVEPTTVEEYRFLQLIGHVAGTENMPPIELPVRGN